MTIWRSAPIIAATIGCALCNDIHTLIVLRFLQGVGGAAGIIIPRAIVRDLYSGVEEVKMMSLLMLVFSVSPLLAPLGGSFLVEDFGWRSVFWMLTALGGMGLALLSFFVRETWPQDKRIKADFAEMKRAYATLFADRAYHDYFYEVAAPYATATRPEYHPDAGYSGSRVTVTAQKQWGNYWLGLFVRYDNLQGAAFSDSPLVQRRDYLAMGAGITKLLAVSKAPEEHP